MIVGQTNAVPAVLIDMQGKGYPGFLQRGREVQAILDRHGCVFRRVPKKGGRRFGCDLEFIGKIPQKF